MKKIKADCHIHTKISPDSKEPLIEICKSAYEKGLTSIVVTNHFEYYTGKQNGSKGWGIEYIENSLQEINECKKEFKDNLEILFGVEFGQAHYWPEEVKKLLKTYSFDYIIGSIHKIEDVDLKYGDYAKENIEKQNKLYLDLLYAMASRGEYDCLGHFDLVKRYAANHNEKIDLMKNYERDIENILKIVIERGKGIEVNTSGLRQASKELMPSIGIIELYKKLGGKIITIGSDAHKKEDVGSEIDSITALLKQLGFNELAIFKKRQPYFYGV